jgi:alpha-tubulin suppressor-like RCC1 family protein
VAIKEDGSLWTWGQNMNGQLGDGTRIDRSEPVRVGSDNDWQYACGGYFQTVAIKTDGSLWEWGKPIGELRRGTPETTGYTPERVGDDNDWRAVRTNSHAVAVKTDGSLWAWGYNGKGQLGNGTTRTRHDTQAKVDF